MALPQEQLSSTEDTALLSQGSRTAEVEHDSRSDAIAEGCQNVLQGSGNTQINVKQLTINAAPPHSGNDSGICPDDSDTPSQTQGATFDPPATFGSAKKEEDRCRFSVPKIFGEVLLTGFKRELKRHKNENCKCEAFPEIGCCGTKVPLRITCPLLSKKGDYVMKFIWERNEDWQELIKEGKVIPEDKVFLCDVPIPPGEAGHCHFRLQLNPSGSSDKTHNWVEFTFTKERYLPEEGKPLNTRTDRYDDDDDNDDRNGPGPGPERSRKDHPNDMYGKQSKSDGKSSGSTDKESKSGASDSSVDEQETQHYRSEDMQQHLISEYLAYRLLKIDDAARVAESEADQLESARCRVSSLYGLPKCPPVLGSHFAAYLESFTVEDFREHSHWLQGYSSRNDGLVTETASTSSDSDWSDKCEEAIRIEEETDGSNDDDGEKSKSHRKLKQMLSREYQNAVPKNAHQEKKFEPAQTGGQGNVRYPPVLRGQKLDHMQWLSKSEKAAKSASAVEREFVDISEAHPLLPIETEHSKFDAMNCVSNHQATEIRLGPQDETPCDNQAHVPTRFELAHNKTKTGRVISYTLTLCLIAVLLTLGAAVLRLNVFYATDLQTNLNKSDEGNKGSYKDIIFPNAFEDRKFQCLYGRDDQIEELYRRFWGQEARQNKTRFTNHRVIEVTGMAGTGKSALAVVYARRHEAAYSGGVFHFNAHSRSSFQQSLGINIARLTEGKYEHGSLEEDYQSFSSLLERRGNVLLVFDGCDKLNVIDNLLPQHSATVHVLVTSRRSKGSRLFDDRTVNIVHLDRLQYGDAIQTILTWSGRSDDLSILDEGERSNASAVVKASGIQALPLALRHVGTRMKGEGMNFTQYQKLMKKKKQTHYLEVEDVDDCLRYYGLQRIRTALSKEGGIDEVTDMTSADLTHLRQSNCTFACPVGRMWRLQERLKSCQFIPWDMDIDETTKSTFLARKILNMAFLMHCELISKDVLKQATFTDATDSEDCERQLSSALCLLSGFSLVEHPCNMHNLIQQSVVQEMMRDRLLSDRLRSLLERLTALVPQTQDGIRRNLYNSTMLSLALHVYSLASHTLNSKDRQQKCWSMLKIACRLVIESHHLKEAENLCERRLGYVNNNSDHQQDTVMLVLALLDLGKGRLQMGKPQLAVEPLKKAFDLCRRTYDNRYPEEYATALGRLAMCYPDLQYLEDEKGLRLEVLRSWKLRLPSKALNSTGIIYWAPSSLRSMYFSLSNIDHYLKIKDSECNKLSLSSTLMSLAFCDQQNGWLYGTSVLFNMAVTILKRQLPPGHPHLTSGLTSLSNVYRELENLDSAFRLTREALDVASASLSTSHPDLGRCMYLVAECHYSMGAMDEAIRYYEKEGKIFSHHLSTEKRFLFVVKYRLALAHTDMKQLEKALQLIKGGLALKMQSLPERHPEIGHWLSLGLSCVRMEISETHLIIFIQTSLFCEKQHQVAISQQTVYIGLDGLQWNSTNGQRHNSMSSNVCDYLKPFIPVGTMKELLLRGFFRKSSTNSCLVKGPTRTTANV